MRGGRQERPAQLTQRELVHQQPRPLASVKDAAYAWRQALFFASMTEPGEADAWALAVAPPRPDPRAAQALLAGLWHVAAKGRFDASGRGGGGRRFYGWTLGRSWVLDKPGDQASSGSH